MSEIQLIGYLIEAITILAGALSTFTVLKKNNKYLVNQLMASSTGCITLYILFITVYDILLPITRNPLYVYIFLPLAITAITVGGLLMFYTMMTITKGSKWMRESKIYLVFLIPVVIFAIFTLSFGSNLITVNNMVEVETSTSKFIMIPMGVLLGFFITSSLILNYRSGIKITTGKVRTKLVRFEIGLAVMLSALLFNLGKMFVNNLTIAPILDMVYFGILALGTVLFAYSLLF